MFCFNSIMHTYIKVKTRGKRGIREREWERERAPLVKKLQPFLLENVNYNFFAFLAHNSQKNHYENWKMKRTFIMFPLFLSFYSSSLINKWVSKIENLYWWSAMDQSILPLKYVLSSRSVQKLFFFFFFFKGWHHLMAFIYYTFTCYSMI